MSTLPPSTRGISLALISTGAAVTLSACGLDDADLGNGNVMDLSVGDCFVESEMDDALSSGEIADVPLVDCSEPHDAEIFHTEDLPDGEFPGDAAINDAVEESCYGSPFTDYIGVDYMESELDVWPLVPTTEGWDMGDQEIVCYAHAPGESFSGSLQDSNR